MQIKPVTLGFAAPASAPAPAPFIGPLISVASRAGSLMSKGVAKQLPKVGKQ